MLSVERVTFRYRPWRSPVLTDWSLNFEAGRTLLLGPNGAGKSTLLALMAGDLKPRAGKIGLGTASSAMPKYRREVAWMPQDVQAVTGCTVREQVALYGWLKGLSRNDSWKSSAEAVDRVGLGDVMGRKAAHLSGGQRARLGLAQALVHRASVILLDEPTASLDPVQKESFRKVLAAIPPETIVVVSTHEIHDIGDAYQRVVGVEQGAVSFDSSMAEFLAIGPDGREGDATSAYAARFCGDA